jgi:hypothetical protein
VIVARTHLELLHRVTDQVVGMKEMYTPYSAEEHILHLKVVKVKNSVLAIQKVVKVKNSVLAIQKAVEVKNSVLVIHMLSRHKENFHTVKTMKDLRIALTLLV